MTAVEQFGPPRKDTAVSHAHSLLYLGWKALKRVWLQNSCLSIFLGSEFPCSVQRKGETSHPPLHLSGAGSEADGKKRITSQLVEVPQ